MNIIERYEKLAEEQKWEEALPVIREIVERSPGIPTSWFNMGVCLSELGRENEAAEAFMKAYELDPEDFGAQYRMFRSLYTAGDYAHFLEMLKRECENDPDMIDHFLEDEDFGVLFERPEFKALKHRYGR